jgi:uncharacterized damage-inducible protein DinB
MQATQNPTSLFTNMALNSWNGALKIANKVLENLSDEQLANEVSPGRNSGIYLLGHLTAVHDSMLPLLGLGEKLYPNLEEAFIRNPDKSGLPKPTVQELKQNWAAVNEALITKFKEQTPEQWLERHTAVTEEDFAKEPHRNKMNVLLSRINHLAYHTGQLALLKSKI